MSGTLFSPVALLTVEVTIPADLAPPMVAAIVEENRYKGLVIHISRIWLCAKFDSLWQFFHKFRVFVVKSNEECCDFVHNWLSNQVLCVAYACKTIFGSVLNLSNIWPLFHTICMFVVISQRRMDQCYSYVVQQSCTMCCWCM